MHVPVPNPSVTRLNLLRFLVFSLLVSLILSISGCASGTASSEPTSASTVLSTVEATGGSEPSFTYVSSVYPLYVTALNLAAGLPDVEVVNMTGTIVGCLHDYQLTPGDLRTIESADAFIVNGADLESYVDQVTSNLPDLPLIVASEGLETLEDNPHLWVSIALMIRQVENMAQQMAAADPSHAKTYAENARIYIDKLTTLQAELHSQIDPLPNRDIVTFHEAFPYFAKEFDLNIVAVIEREPDSRPSAAELAETIDLIRSLDMKAIFVEPQYEANTADTIARETGVAVYTLDPASSGPLEDPDAYLDIMRRNGQTLVEALR